MGYSLFNRKMDAVADLSKSWGMLHRNFNQFKEQYETFSVSRIGRFLEGTAFYHEVDEYYTCVGFEVEVEVRYRLGDGTVTDMDRETGFYAVWMGRAHNMAPFTFEESYQSFGDSYRFENGFGDHFEVHKVLKTVDEVNQLLNQ